MHVPETSREAYREHKESGRAETDDKKALYWITIHPGHTYRELAYYAGMDHNILQRAIWRMKALGQIKEGETKKCAIGCRRMKTYYRDNGSENPEKFHQPELFID